MYQTVFESVMYYLVLGTFGYGLVLAVVVPIIQWRYNGD